MAVKFLGRDIILPYNMVLVRRFEAGEDNAVDIAPVAYPGQRWEITFDLEPELGGNLNARASAHRAKMGGGEFEITLPQPAMALREQDKIMYKLGLAAKAGTRSLRIRQPAGATDTSRVPIGVHFVYGGRLYQFLGPFGGSDFAATGDTYVTVGTMQTRRIEVQPALHTDMVVGDEISVADSLTFMARYRTDNRVSYLWPNTGLQRPTISLTAR